MPPIVTTKSCAHCSRPAATNGLCCQHAQEEGRKAHKKCPCRHGQTVVFATFDALAAA